ncbi:MULTISPECIES: bifunctional riboflavin kinase/FAD synthetase [Calothrix]|uniref:Riboflavin biosynthesis protein n=2 Tax=Calothrix TaxID=1186 RepID=A0ABR8AFI7_9CYAN|nr:MULTISPECIES: bifunctional riboflavin kinase/FAD synthetase [Calothrix]MBD2198807.1 bifunctional riboflavin kinase/FAD synthetase [Calothrix parietina FACHB-288]MBD2227147.1 bifunctional riboflavin kinase/FAD synthetase [Calothrix anomala FACHB-343]
MLNLSQNGCSVWVASATEELLTPTAVALGKFDGVHLGHQRVIKPVLQRANKQVPPRTLDAEESNVLELSPTDATNHIYSTVVTFHPHPQEFFSGQPRALLTPLDEKVAQLRSLGIEQLVLLPFDKELSALSPEEFVEKILVQKLRCQQLSVGQDFCFGKQRTGTARDLQLLAAKYDIPVTIVTLEKYAGKAELPPENHCVDFLPTPDLPISTSLIRQTLENGDVKNANLLLGRPYTLFGLVIQGQQLGRTIGFPTANLQLPKDKFLPRFGVYAVRVFLTEPTAQTSIPLLGVMNIGNRPTVAGINTSVEVHLFDWAGDLYGKQLAVQLVEFLRPEQKFSSLEALKAQIQLDCNIAKEVLLFP